MLMNFCPAQNSLDHHSILYFLNVKPIFFGGTSDIGKQGYVIAKLFFCELNRLFLTRALDPMLSAIVRPGS